MCPNKVKNVASDTTEHTCFLLGLVLDHLLLRLSDACSQDLYGQVGHNAGINLSQFFCVCLPEHFGNHYIEASDNND